MHGAGAAEMTAVTSYSCQQSPLHGSTSRAGERERWRGRGKKKCCAWQADPSAASITGSSAIVFKSQTAPLPLLFPVKLHPFIATNDYMVTLTAGLWRQKKKKKSMQTCLRFTASINALFGSVGTFWEYFSCSAQMKCNMLFPRLLDLCVIRQLVAYAGCIQACTCARRWRCRQLEKGEWKGSH